MESLLEASEPASDTIMNADGSSSLAVIPQAQLASTRQLLVVRPWLPRNQPPSTRLLLSPLPLKVNMEREEGIYLGQRLLHAHSGVIRFNRWRNEDGG